MRVRYHVPILRPNISGLSDASIIMMKERENEPQRDDSQQSDKEPLPDRNPEWEDRSGHNKFPEREYKDYGTRKQ